MPRLNMSADTHHRPMYLHGVVAWRKTNLSLPLPLLSLQPTEKLKQKWSILFLTCTITLSTSIAVKTQATRHRL